MLQRTLPAGFIAPCLPTKTEKLPSGDLRVHEIKHDGFRVSTPSQKLPETSPNFKTDTVRLHVSREKNGKLNLRW